MRGENVEHEKGDLRSAKIILQLPKSSYATIVIREILHIPSSFKVQTELNRLYDRLWNFKSKMREFLENEKTDGEWWLY
jgi:tRNA(Glu) U13 pseudouridine synthase TruD